VRNREIGVRTATGERRTVLLTLRLEAGESFLEGTVVNMSDRKRTEEALLVAMRERIKESTCLFELSRLTERQGHRPPGHSPGTVRTAAADSCHADVAGARIGWKATSSLTWFCREPLATERAAGVVGEPAGFVEVCYSEERPAADDGPFLAEELSLLTTVAQQLEHAVERYRALIRTQIREERFALAARGANDGIWDWDLVTGRDGALAALEVDTGLRRA